ncbi:hypothetical protein GAP31_053 [Cronobacter phage vB_CsaM_GAP31]|uniref:DUF8033 domain-containing protein n=1 Tax=Cronobacter phage vB_CsaM_GAP31 TaxID=1141135 RepID=K4FAV0_9CAUD|nr:hypothetical protein GAP31_053 [Cronobacter phage vB_CsaM_GAP31]AFC21234.1 hypothetical protein GAP31_053 [Cronobacter phage vB_CsaM_GAP31]
MKVNSLAANQTEITKSNGDQVFVSYSTPVAAIIGGLSYKTDRKYSATTTRHVNAWLGNGGVNAISKPQDFFDNLI